MKLLTLVYSKTTQCALKAVSLAARLDIYFETQVSSRVGMNVARFIIGQYAITMVT